MGTNMKGNCPKKMKQVLLICFPILDFFFIVCLILWKKKQNYLEPAEVVSGAASSHPFCFVVKTFLTFDGFCTCFVRALQILSLFYLFAQYRRMHCWIIVHRQLDESRGGVKQKAKLVVNVQCDYKGDQNPCISVETTGILDSPLFSSWIRQICHRCQRQGGKKVKRKTKEIKHSCTKKWLFTLFILP